MDELKELDEKLGKMMDDFARGIVERHLRVNYGKGMKETQNSEMMVDVVKDAFYLGQRLVHITKPSRL